MIQSTIGQGKTEGESTIGQGKGSDLISRQAAIDIANDIRDCISVNGYWAWMERLKKLPSADPVKHGKWEKISVRNYKCSCCNAWWSVDRNSTMKDFKYCPSCGARMDTDGEET